MVTRSGDLDPSIVTYLMKKENLSADEIEKICDEIWHHANTIHLYSSLAEEESKSITMKEKQKEIIRTTEEILNIIYKYKGNV